MLYSHSICTRKYQKPCPGSNPNRILVANENGRFYSCSDSVKSQIKVGHAMYTHATKDPKQLREGNHRIPQAGTRQETMGETSSGHPTGDYRRPLETTSVHPILDLGKQSPTQQEI